MRRRPSADNTRGISICLDKSINSSLIKLRELDSCERMLRKVDLFMLLTCGTAASEQHWLYFCFMNDMYK